MTATEVMTQGHMSMYGVQLQSGLSFPWAIEAAARAGILSFASQWAAHTCSCQSMVAAVNQNVIKAIQNTLVASGRICRSQGWASSKNQAKKTQPEHSNTSTLMCLLNVATNITPRSFEGTANWSYKL